MNDAAGPSGPAVVAGTPSSLDDEEVRVLPELWPLKFE